MARDVIGLDVTRDPKLTKIADMKVKQAEKLIEAHDDVNLAYHTGNQGLGIAQTDERASLRRRKQAAESKLDDLERSVQRLKKAADEG